MTDKELNLFKSESFGLGIILLEMGILESVQPIYRPEKGEVSERILGQLVDKFEDRYGDSPLLCGMLKALIEINPKKRSDCRNLNKRLPDINEIRVYFEELQKRNSG